MQSFDSIGCDEEEKTRQQTTAKKNIGYIGFKGVSMSFLGMLKKKTLNPRVTDNIQYICEGTGAPWHSL